MVRFTQHTRVVARERRIAFDWIRRTVASPERVETQPDGTVHYLARVPERDGRWLRVVGASESDDVRVIMAFFDRRVARTRP